MALSQARVLGPGGREGNQTQRAAAVLTGRGCGREWVSQVGSLVSAGRRGKGFSESTCLRGYDNNNRWLLCVPGVPGWSLGQSQGWGLGPQSPAGHLAHLGSAPFAGALLGTRAWLDPRQSPNSCNSGLGLDWLSRGWRDRRGWGPALACLVQGTCLLGAGCVVGALF